MTRVAQPFSMRVKKRPTASRSPRPSHRRAHPPQAQIQQSVGVDPRLREGVALYNHQQFFECHEVLEQVWLNTTDSSKDFYKGLIQAAVACYHWSLGNRPGALTLARSACRYLKRYGPVYHELDVEQFLQQFSELFQWLRKHPQRYDSRLVPVMRWVATS